MKIKTAVFETSAPDLRSCPKWVLPEFAFIGRSNVGKSSLINALAARRDLAKVSSTPGKTQLINFYVINEAWSIVDLPGYGYAEVGRQRRFEFNAAVAEFLSGRRNLRGVFVLIDSRLEPQAIDFEFLRWLDGCARPRTRSSSPRPTSSRPPERARTSTPSWPPSARGARLCPHGSPARRKQGPAARRCWGISPRCWRHRTGPPGRRGECALPEFQYLPPSPSSWHATNPEILNRASGI
jgi:GTP-binding protein